MDGKALIAGAFTGLALAGALAGMGLAHDAGQRERLTTAEAIEIALAQVSGEVVETGLERENGLQVFEIEIRAANGTESEVEIDAITGEVIEVDVEHERMRR